VIAILRSEWIKMRTVRMNLVLLSLAVALPFLICGLTAAFGNADGFAEDDVVGIVSGASVLTAILLAVIGAVTVTGEFGFNTIRPTFAATPQRWRVITAKAIVTALAAMAVQATVTLLCYGGMRAIIGARGGEITPFDPEGLDTSATFSNWPPILGVIIFAMIVSLLGMAVGLLIHNTPAAVCVVILWPLLLEQLIGGILSAAGVDNASKYMPYTAGINLGNPLNDDTTLGRVGGGLYFAAVTLGVWSLGAVWTSRRDA
jgi:ABC-2 type transport system permease protein